MTRLVYVGGRLRQALVDRLTEELLVATRVGDDAVRKVGVAAELGETRNKQNAVPEEQ